MFATRAVSRSSGAFSGRSLRHTARNARRFASTESGGSGSNPAFVGALSGGLTALVVGYGWYHFSGAKTLVHSANQTKAYFKTAQDKLKQAAPEAPDDTLQWLRETALSYGGLFPGAKMYINSAFDDLDTVRQKHGDEVDRIVKQAYGELKTTGQKEMSMETASEAWNIIEKYLSQIADLAGDAADDILNNHPELKEKVGGNFDQLKDMGAKYGPEAQKQVDQTWNQIKEIVAAGWTGDTVNRIRKLVEEKTEQVKKLGDEAWQKGMEQARPYLEKNPKVKELVEQNADALKSGNVTELYNKIKSAIESGSTEDLEKYIKSATDKAKQSGGFGGLEEYLSKIPGGDKVIPQLSKMSQIAQKHGKEAEKILSDTVDEIQQVLKKKSEEAEKLASRAEKEAK
jgi:hypothetical protein